MKTLTLDIKKLSLIRTSVETRIQRLDEMIRIFSNDTKTPNAKWMEEKYREEKVQAEALALELERMWLQN